MAQADNPQLDMLRIAPEAAKEILAQNAAEVFRLLANEPKKLSPLDVVKSGGLAYLEYREFAVKKDALPDLDKWAKRKAAELTCPAPERNKSKEAEI